MTPSDPVLGRREGHRWHVASWQEAAWRAVVPAAAILDPWLASAYATLLAGFAVSTQVSGSVPARLALNAVGAITLVATAYLIAASFGAGSRSRGALAVGTALAAWIPLFGEMPPPNITRGDAASPMLWSITLQSPDQGIRRLLPLPGHPREMMRLRVVLGQPYHGASFLTASINSADVGQLVPMGSNSPHGSFSVDYAQLEVVFNKKAITMSIPMEVVVRQPMTDPKLRIAVWGSHAGTVFTRDAAWFGTGSSWVRGTPNALTGKMVDGVPIMWLSDAE